MKWRGRQGSSNVEDRRSIGSKGVIGGGIGIVLVLVVALLGGDPSAILGALQGDQSSDQPYEQTQEEKDLYDFASVVLADTETVWTQLFLNENMTYQAPRMVIFNGGVSTGCGSATSQTGPFYCPGDQKVYIDLSFYRELRDKFNAPGDFALAYVIAHEVGHHIQYLTGIMEQMNEIRQQVSREEYNKYSVRLELQADYLAGVWARHVQGMGYLESGDIEEAINAAGAVGDDKIQEEMQGYVVPDTFTHGTSEQRMKWFMKGFDMGNFDGWNTFDTNDL